MPDCPFVKACYHPAYTGPTYSYDIETEIKQFTKERIKMANNDQYKRNKFYVGSNSVFDRNWGRRTLPEAIKQATELMEKQGSDEVFIVKIVKVVRRKQAPIEVVDV